MTAIAHRVTFGGLLRSEWIKLFSLRTTWWLYAITIVLFVGVAALSALSSGSWASSYLNPENPAIAAAPGASAPSMPAALVAVQVNAELVRWAAPVLLFAALVVSVLGVIAMAGEFGTGMIKSTFAAAPRRTDALLSKLLVCFLASVATGAIGTLLATAVSAGIMSANGWAIDLADPYLWRALGGTIGYVGFAGAFGVLIGALIRVQAGAIPTAIGILLVLPTIVALLSSLLDWNWLTNTAPFLPSNLGNSFAGYPTAEAMQAADPDGSSYVGSGSASPWLNVDQLDDGTEQVTRLSVGDALAGLLLLAWLVIAWAFAQLVTKRNDA